MLRPRYRRRKRLSPFQGHAALGHRLTGGGQIMRSHKPTYGQVFATVHSISDGSIAGPSVP